jgi:hypothetical protein
MLTSLVRVGRNIKLKQRYKEFLRGAADASKYADGPIYCDRMLPYLLSSLTRTRVICESEHVITRLASQHLPCDELPLFYPQSDTFVNYLIDTRDVQEFYFAHGYFFLQNHFFYERNHTNLNRAVFKPFKNLTFKSNSNEFWTSDNFSCKYDQVPKKIRHVDTPIISLNTNNNVNYFHWLQFPGLINYSAAVAAKIGDLSSFNFYLGPLGNENIPSYITDSLKILGIPSENTCLDPVRSDRMIASFQHTAKMTISPRHVNFLREAFSSSLKNSKIDLSKTRIFISRSDASSRQLINEDEIYNYLNVHYDFKKVILSNLSISEQAVIFYNAEIIVGPHGAGLTNITFGRKEQILIELISPNHVNNFFYRISELIGVRHGYILGEALGRSSNANFGVRLSKIRDFFKYIGLY